MKNSYTIWKNLGETPLEALERLRAGEGIAADVPMTYAGRLDPAAEGLLPILVGEECKNKQAYSGQAKTYMAEILLGVSTDSYDLLGLPTQGAVATLMTDEDDVRPGIAEKIEQYLASKIGTHSQQYPPYSSKTVDGKQLHTHAREGNDVELPEHEVTLHSYEDLSVEPISSEDILVRAGELVTLVKGDFRQDAILQAWADLKLPEKLPLLVVTIKVGSGFYVRQLAEDIGKALGTKACLYSLIRTEIGEPNRD